MTGDTRTNLLDAAQTSFAENGYAGTSIRALARAVGIKESSVYNHFAGKQALLEAVVDRAEARMEAVAASMSIPADEAAATAYYDQVSPGRLQEITQALVSAWLHDPNVIAARRILILEQFRNPAAGARLRELTIEAPLAFQTRLFARLIQDGSFKPADPAAVALAFWGPLATILASAEAAPDDPRVAERIHKHLVHFTDTHVATSRSGS